MRARRATPRRRESPRGDTAWWENANRLLLTRCDHRCDRCRRPLGGAMERHHRQRRAVGGDRLSNLLALHPTCHTWITEHPAEATAAGWIVSSYAPDPAAVPVDLGGRLYLLDDDGHAIPVPDDG